MKHVQTNAAGGGTRRVLMKRLILLYALGIEARRKRKKQRRGKMPLVKCMNANDLFSRLIGQKKIQSKCEEGKRKKNMRQVR
jgi:hypothetical protein